MYSSFFSSSSSPAASSPNCDVPDLILWRARAAFGRASSENYLPRRKGSQIRWLIPGSLPAAPRAVGSNWGGWALLLGPCGPGAGRVSGAGRLESHTSPLKVEVAATEIRAVTFSTRIPNLGCVCVHDAKFQVPELEILFKKKCRHVNRRWNTSGLVGDPKEEGGAGRRR